MSQVKTIFVQAIEKPARKVLAKRGVKATDYFEYCNEVGCEVWDDLTHIEAAMGEPVCLWLPPHLIKPGTSEYVQGVEVALDYAGKIPDGFDVIELPSATYLMFRGEPFDNEEFCAAIGEVRDAIGKYDPLAFGYIWDKLNPRIQLEPRGERGYIELLPVLKA